MYVCSFRAWNKFPFPFSHNILLSPFRIPVTNCHYIFHCRFTSFILSFKNVWSICSMPGSRHSELWRIYWWLRARSLFSWSLVSGGKGRQESIQCNSNKPRRKMLVATIPGQSSTPNRVLWHKALPLAISHEGCPEELTDWELKVGRRQPWDNVLILGSPVFKVFWVFHYPVTENSKWTFKPNKYLGATLGIAWALFITMSPDRFGSRHIVHAL